jgi:AraC-like DNA-binding protein
VHFARFAANPIMPTSAEQAADWLLSGLDLHSTLFHVGRYCSAYRASTAGHQRASFHLILEGACWLHLPATPVREACSTCLVAGDAVFFMRDMAHCLTPDPNAPGIDDFALRICAMTPLDAGSESADGVALACGFFEFRSDLGEAINGLLPDHIVARHDDARLTGARAIFDLIHAESRGHEGRSVTAHQPPDRRTVLLRIARRRERGRFRAGPVDGDAARGVRTTRQRDHRQAGGDWSTHVMAAFCHMSRARFCKQFAEVCGHPPAQFLALLRMKVAAEMLRHGALTVHAAEHVGYQSESAFAQGFKRITGLQPGGLRRERARTAETRVH